MILNPALKANKVQIALKLQQAGEKVPKNWKLKVANVIPPERNSHKLLTLPLRKTGGRNHHGRITCRHRGGGFKRRIRLLDGHPSIPIRNGHIKANIDMAKSQRKEPRKVIRIDHDPNRSAKLALLQHKSGLLSYVTASKDLKAGETFDGECRRAL